MTVLPDSDRVNVGVFGQVFRDTTNSYKYLLLRALLDRVVGHSLAIEPIALQELAIDMLAVAYVPSQVFKLSLGARDQLAKLLGALPPELKPPRLASELRARADTKFMANLEETLLRYVPYRLIRRFFAADLRGLRDSQINGKLVKLADERFHTVRPLYRITGAGLLEVHPDWIEYLRANQPVVSDWFSWNWASYLQECNPNVPGVMKKLYLPRQRQDLSWQTTYWRKVLEEASLCCIYSGEPIVACRFELDHFLPWTFVAHDQLWNLVPVAGAVNQEKSNWVPDLSYLKGLIETQHKALETMARRDGRDWRRVCEEFMVHLRIPQERDLLDLDRLEIAYRGAVEPLARLAVTMGFREGWRYRACQPSTHSG